MPFLPANQQRQSTEGTSTDALMTDDELLLMLLMVLVMLLVVLVVLVMLVELVVLVVLRRCQIGHCAGLCSGASQSR